MTWNVFRGKLEFGGTEYHGEAAEFDKIIGLPPRCVVWRVAALCPRAGARRDRRCRAPGIGRAARGIRVPGRDYRRREDLHPECATSTRNG
jgi:hypothetical protein